MDQTEFQRALKKFEAQKRKRAEAALKPLESAVAVNVNPAMPFLNQAPAPKKVKLIHPPQEQPKDLEITVSGPVSMKFSIFWSGTLMGGQINEKTLKELFTKHLQPMGRVR